MKLNDEADDGTCTAGREGPCDDGLEAQAGHFPAPLGHERAEAADRHLTKSVAHDDYAALAERPRGNVGERKIGQELVENRIKLPATPASLQGDASRRLRSPRTP
jgi:hypothetical protein